MGYSRWSDDDWKSYSTTTSAKAASAVFTSRTLTKELDPKGVIRESRDSDLNPNSTPVIIGGDVTGSMGSIAYYLVTKGLGTVFQEILERKPVSDPHVAFYAIGDVRYDRSPLQVSQFEADLTIAKWLEKVHVEQGGGGNAYESYDMPYYFAGYHTSHDAFEKRGKKGYIFTYGDEGPPPNTPREWINAHIGDSLEVDPTFDSSLAAAQKMYYCYHIIIAEGSHTASYGPERVREQWVPLFGQNVVILDDHKNLAETIISIMEINEGKDAASVISSWSGDTSLVVASAVKNLKATAVSTDTVVRF
ncbi:MAG: hypothetical protein QXN55_00315 [Candidatus Nitrosotenuis sp.]